jgi:predicted DNA-binding protein (UPF0251 family)
MKQEAERGGLNQVQNTAAQAMGISHSTMQSILQKGKCNVTQGKQFSTSQEKRIRMKTITEDEFDKCVTHGTIR